jgi:hypothetical protein
MITLADVEAIFRRQGWNYRLENGRIVTSFGNVLMVIGIARNGRDVMITAAAYIANSADLSSFQAHRNEIRTFLGYVSSHISFRGTASGSCTLVLEDDGVFVHTVVSFISGAANDAVLRDGIAITEFMVGAIRPFVVALAQGRITAQQAITGLDRALAELARRQGRQSA